MIKKNIDKILREIPEYVQLVAISKTRSNQEILDAYNSGQISFGENKIQEMTKKFEDLPKNIDWHMVGHVQSNKIKYKCETKSKGGNQSKQSVGYKETSRTILTVISTVILSRICNFS